MMLEDPYVEAALQAPPSPDYVPGPEHPPSPVYVPYILEPIYPEFMPPEDDVLLTEEQPLLAAVSPTVDSPGYITESDHKEDPEKDDEDPEEDPADYPTDRDDGREEEEESSGDDVDDEKEDEDEDEEEEHPAPADSVPPPVHRVTARMSIRAQTPISFPLDTEVARLLAIPTPPPSPLSPLSSPLPQILSPLPQILSPPLPVSPPPLPASPTYPLGYRAVMIRLRAESPSASRPLTLPSPIVLPYTKAYVAMMRVVWDLRSVRVDMLPLLDLLEALEQTMDLWALWMMRLGETLRERQDTDEIYRRLDDIQDDRSLMSSQLNMLHRDRCAHTRTARLMETEARLSREAWVQSMDASDTARSEVRALRTTVLAQQTPHLTDTACGDTDTDKDTADTGDSTLESVRTR
ncbi:hypothetical protein Tco_1366822, partial [Tanacetum coccineum]